MDLIDKIKCSNCSVDIDILRLADHVCVTTPPKAVEPTSPKLDRAATFGSSSFNKRLEDEPRSRPPPPKIDSYAANKPFLAPDLTLAPSPLSNHSDSVSRSPVSFGDGRSPYQMNRSATSPMPRPLAPDLTPNMDSAFPPFPTRRNATPTSAKPESRDRLGPSYPQQYAAPSPLFAPVSPRTNGGESVLKRMNTIAPGPFDGRRPSTSGSGGPRTPVQDAQPRGHRRTNTQGSTKSNGFAPNHRTSLASTVSHGSNGGNGMSLRQKNGIGGSAMAPPPPPPRTTPQEEGIDAFLQRLQEETMRPSKIGQESRSKTYPIRKESRDVDERQASPVDSRSPPRRPTDIELSNVTPRSNNAFPPRGSSRDESQSTLLRKDLPPLPPVPSYARDTTEQVYTPSDSGHSEDSYASSGFRSAASSRSSPPSSEAAHSRQASRIGRSDYLSEEPMRRTYSPEPFIEPRSAPWVPENRRRNESSSRGRAAEPRVDSRFASPPPADRSRNESSSRGRAPESRPQIPSKAPELPLDPAIQLGLPFDEPNERKSLRDPALNFAPSPPRSPSPQRRMPPPARRPTTANKGKCRGCAEPIVGKSVKDSSGRLTGRYHKECFVCRTCSSPFPTAEFYVFENHPYCEHHYHKLNDSICRSCNRGIEGQYLETDQRLKFHPRCFTCSSCRIVLRDDYYQIGGRNFCERHAFPAVEKQNGFLGIGPGGRGRNVQKRRTRMMMMV
ncbi:hypothetical protein K458DRAFT_77279 [Lentithecium fluviatile CBS 122367]|uniref:LIM zinc-binding domain-containing protein n=1 Tax=Lentithecium fluviatile CBS 122367 TaxID=1168545 RepID=A0A6G1IUK9_9PLEO|nr:hypothetical protein K458DRAFT_77279 [Lentithecium fluviatile CBS 122367]